MERAYSLLVFTLLTVWTMVNSSQLVPLSLSDQVTVFQRGEGGYYCIKIPVLVATASGALLAFGEGRMFSCSDFTWTDLIYKRSDDGGKTWGPLNMLYSNSSNQTGSVHTVIGNAAPVVLKESGRILVPFCRNNLQVLLTYSDDDGKSWSHPVNLTNVTLPSWSWVGTGPPGSIQLDSGRVIVPSYHEEGPKFDGDLTQAHMMISDDEGKTWYIGGRVSDGIHFPNENQAVTLGGNLVFVNARSLLTDRVGAFSKDGGLTFKSAHSISGLSQPLTGCEGSMTRQKSTGMLFYSGPNVGSLSTLRYNMSVATSTDNGETWSWRGVVHAGSSAYSSLVDMVDGRVGLLYEWANKTQTIFDPDYFSFVTIS